MQKLINSSVVLLSLFAIASASAQLLTRPATPPSSTLNSNPPSLYCQWYKYADQEEKLVTARDAQIASLSAQLVIATAVSSETRAQIAAIAQRVTVIVIGGTLPKLTVSWDDNSTNELGFKVERSTDGGATWKTTADVGANVTSWADLNLSPGTYSYRVYAYNATNQSAYSNVATTALP